LPPLIRSLCPTDTAAVADKAAGAVPALNPPGDVTAAVGGESEDTEEGFRNVPVGYALLEGGPARRNKRR
jgi:hypothetical protein